MTLVLRHATLMTCDPARPELGVIADGAVAFEGDRIAWIGPSADAPAGETLDLGGALVTPGLVDCHTHAIFAGDRAREFGMRAAGADYLAIAAAGGGIAATLGPTRAASDTELDALLASRLDGALAGGTTTIEVKTGYDLTTDGELRMLRAIRRIGAARGQRVIPTLLVHLVPPERRADRDEHVREVCEDLIPAAAGIAASVDIYVDEGAFTLDEARRVWGAATRAGIAVRGHIGQFRDLGAAELLAEYGGLSADHLEQVSPAGIAALARAGTVAVMLPGACVQVRLPVPPIAALRAAGVPMAIASDLNPGTSFCETLPIQLWLATTHFAMTVEEAWLGVTRHGARALGLADAGALVVGARADAVLWRATDPAHVPYRYGGNLVERVYVAGRAAF